MPTVTVTLRPTNAALIGTEGMETVPGSAIVGEAPQLGDESDLTYLRLHAASDGAAADGEIGTTTLAPLTESITATAFRMCVRASVEGVEIPTDLLVYFVAGLSNSWTPDTLGPKDYVYEISEAAFPEVDPASVQAYLAALVTQFMTPYPVAVSALSATDPTWVRFYEVWIEFDYAGTPIVGRVEDAVRIFCR